MNKDNAHEYLPYVQALVDGKEVEVQLSDGTWDILPDYDFTLDPDQYSIKLESEKWYVATWFDNGGNKWRWSVPYTDKKYLERSFEGAINLKIHEFDLGEAPAPQPSLHKPLVKNPQDAVKLQKECEILRTALEMIAGKRPCIDNLMGNADIAREALLTVEKLK